ncbi:type VI secretion system tube protein Hcp [Pontiella agarivorans]|uniref:Type VI secretion system tube protein Hcp n=1 Tax=Pontiella agarivorans TaxID=3038953 RepID=A0ABU5MWE2_9BACT|nr:type VI secretion system tube protein Hcp [Pontiella agarivorans]MDZ8118520.1 type VI secretion system tube protein Hcp [Pontiella agarivorans]
MKKSRQLIKGKRRLFAVCTSLLMAVVSSEAQTRLYAKFTNGPAGITYTGDVENPLYRGDTGWIELESLSFGVENSVTVGGGTTGGGGAGKASFNDIELEKAVNSASAALFQTCVTGAHWEDVEIVLVNPGFSGSVSRPYAVMKIELKLVMVQSITSNASSNGELPIESVVLKYGAHRITFYQPDPETGQVSEVGMTEWSVVLNDSVFTVSP